MHIRHTLSIIIIAALVTAVTPAPSPAQQFELGVDLLGGIPQSAFKRNVNQTGFGASVHAGYGPAEVPLFVGVRVTFLQYGEQSDRSIIQGPFSPIDADVSTTNNIITPHLVLRMQPNVGRFRPYLEGFLGWNHLYTETSIKGAYTEDEISSDTWLSDNAFAWGAGGGVQFAVSGSTLDDPEAQPDGISLNASVRYSFGGNARYLKEGSLYKEGDRVVFDTLESTTNLLLISVGIVIHL